MNALFAVDKPIGLSSNSFLMRLKKKYGWKKCGYSGTLDPFASGLLVVGVGSYTRLFSYLDKGVKSYEATLWLGVKSASLDIEQVEGMVEVEEFSLEQIFRVLESLRGKVSYVPPRFSAKHIEGKRAYELARDGVSFELKPSEMEVFEIKLLSYHHPFISFSVSVSEGGYIRSLGEIIAKRLGCEGSLSYLRRVKEGEIKVPDGIKKLEVLDALKLERIDLKKFKNEVYHGKKLVLHGEFFHQERGVYLADFGDFFSIIEVSESGQVRYLLNRIPKC